MKNLWISNIYIMHPNVYLYLHWTISIVVIAFLAYLLFNHFLGKMKRNIRLEGFESTSDVSGNQTTESEPSIDSSTNKLPTSIASGDVSGNQIASVSDKASSSEASSSEASSSVTTNSNSTSDADKSSLMSDLFETVNKQMDIIRTFKLSDTLVPVKIDKTPQEDILILANLKLLVNNGVSKNELDLKEVYDKYIGNKAVQVLVSDLNSLNLVKAPDNVADLETTFLSRTKGIVDAHQKIIDNILDNKSKQ
jgi:hypothetical protein